ncbi:MAG: hypothetical protein MJ245_00780 [Clostridia bacterium]|nr:hypothetical protein [Clostridia bacterium]
MNKIVRYACFLLVIASILTACVNTSEEAKLRENESNNASDVIKTSISENNYARYDLLMERYINETKIYGISVLNGIYDKVQVIIAGQSKDFEWSSLADDNYLPKIYYADINADEINECIIVLTDNVGDGFISQKIHVLNPETLDEFEFENIKSYIEKNIKTKKDKDFITMSLDDEEIVKCEVKEEGEPSLTYDDNITYKVDDKIIVNVIFKLDGNEVMTKDFEYSFDNDKLIYKKGE